MSAWVDGMKMVAISSVEWLVLCLIVILLAGVSEEAIMLFTATPKWPVFLVFALLGHIAMKPGYWRVFQRLTFYGSR